MTTAQKTITVQLGDSCRAEICHGESIRLVGTLVNYRNPTDYDKTYRIGDTAEFEELIHLTHQEAYDLMRAIEIDFTKPVKTRGGHQVEIYNAERRHGAVRIDGSYWSVEKWDEYGRCIGYTVRDFDLIQEPQKQISYLNIYRHDKGHLFVLGASKIYTRKDADDENDWAIIKRVGCIRLELEEGRFDE